MPFCYAPWSNIDISPRGRISPCCKFQSDQYPETFNLQTSSIEDYRNSNLLNVIKQEFEQGQWPAGCERCRIEEENNISSKRLLDYERWQELYQNYNLNKAQYMTASIAFGNTCNLTCITCNPESSSRWQREWQAIHNVDIQPYHFYKQNFIEDFISHSPDIRHLDIPGGEPFLSGVNEQKQLLSYYINTNQSDKITLHYTTNVTVFPDSEWWELWKYFKEVDIQLSIDGVGKRQEYIRYPSNWHDIVANTQQYLCCNDANIRLSVSHTVSAYNIFYLDEFFTWCYGIGLPRPWLGKVHNPVYMRPGVWDESSKAVIVEHLKTSQYPDVHAWADLINTTDDSTYFGEFKNKIAQHDAYRGLDFKQTFPELANFI